MNNRKEQILIILLVASALFFHWWSQRTTVRISRAEARTVYASAWEDGYAASRMMQPDTINYWRRDSLRWEGHLWRVFVKQ